ncbi:TPA: type II secretion system protein GspH [Candidatus Berkelbacteria bacterium]|uniref:General secretion pathway protein H, type IV fimbrial biogenesis protein FimT n=1 Tax=Berkelbacteria bacterium GW2011_GWE1_39_12 TaxID=1618337 RepID=A0A0G4B2H2_9BACT|nr:MAG: general secretion pathway protein H, type IV fimbrial biogenesis protein FimT [Berkelbacteria bacterium GW2011_GWE1_39_12]HBO60649.1 type II secretion system protein GspH [Candidatus Berkelbacteria bacterium]
MNYLKRKKISQGFTLIELIIVIAIMGILTAAVTPTVSSYLPGIRLNGTARGLTSDLRESQEKSITEQKQYLIRFNSTSIPPTYDIIRLVDANEELQKQIILPNNEQLTLGETITNNQIIFSPDGGPSSSGNLTLSINSITKVVNVSPAGFISIR